MRTSTAAIGSAAFFVVAPGTFVGLGPWLITHWEIPGSSPPLRVILGVVLIVLGLIPPVHAFIQFAKAGGTPMPVAPTERLVVTGFNRFVRNPMYVGLLTAILGQALLFDSPWLVLYAVIGWIATASFVHWYEEPTLVRTYGEQYEEYRRNVPAWTPRLTPWNPAASERWWFVVGGEPGLALSFFFGDEFGSFAAFLVDAVAAVLLAGLFAAGHHCACGRCRADAHAGGIGSSPVDWPAWGTCWRRGVRWCKCARSAPSTRWCRRVVVDRSSRRFRCGTS